MPSDASMPGLSIVLERVAACRETCEVQRRLPDEVVVTLVQAGLFRLGIPESIGGAGLAPARILDVLEVLTAADAAVAWCVWNNLLPSLLAQRLAPQARAELFEGRDIVYGNSTRATGQLAVVNGGYRLSGRWSLVSGCQAATHFALLGVVTSDGVPREVAPGIPEARLAFVPTAAVEIIDTWYAGGLRGTGSHDVAANTAWVTADHTCTFIGPAPGADGPLDRFPTMSLMTAGIAMMLLALGTVCCDALTSISAEHVATDSRPQAMMRPALTQGLARATANIGAARTAVRGAVERIGAALEGGEVPLLVRAELFEAVDLARRLGLDAIRSLYELGGTASVYTAQPIERAHRDAHVMVQHIGFDSMWVEQAGRVRLGLQPTNPMF